MSLKIRERADGVTIECRIQPRSGRTAIKGARDGILQISLNAPPIEGRANRALIELISKRLGVRKSSISIAGGEHSRNKVLFIEGLTRDEAAAKLSDI